MKSFATILFILGILGRIYLTTAKSPKAQNAPIIAGKRAEVGQFPWHVLVNLAEDADSVDEICGGSIIAEKWVLTAAHCFIGTFYAELVFGNIERNDTETTMVSRTVFVHPDFNRHDGRNDIALIELPTDLDFTHNIGPIELVSSTHAANNFIGVDVTVTGFGQTQDTDPRLSDWLMWCDLEIVNNSVCDRVYDTPMWPTELCAIGLSGSNMSICNGDSGGAVVWKNENNDLVQIGIALFAKLNRCSQYPTGHTKVVSYLDFIHNITGIDFDKKKRRRRKVIEKFAIFTI